MRIIFANRKELYKCEAKAHNTWGKKWGFLKDRRKLVEEEAAKMGLDLNICNRKKCEESLLSEPKNEKAAVTFDFRVGRPPLLSSGLLI